jgi:hypothetical protein
MRKRVARPPHERQRHDAEKLLLEASDLLWELADRDRCAISGAAARAVYAVRERLLSDDRTALNRIAGYKRSAHLQGLMDECDAIVAEHCAAGDRLVGVASAVSHAIVEVPRLVPEEIPPAWTWGGESTWARLEPLPAHKQYERVEHSLGEAARDIAAEILKHVPSPRHPDGHSAVRAALVTWGVSNDRATGLLKFLQARVSRRKS